MDEELKNQVATVPDGSAVGASKTDAGAPTEAPAQSQEPATDEYPNRSAYAKRFSARHKDTDFEDKEARYAALMDDADRLDSYENSGRSLSKVFEKNRWLAAMLEDLRQDEKLDPVSWMADNGIDIAQALDDDDYRKTISERIAAFQKRQIEGEKAMEQRTKNLEQSAKNLEAIGVDGDDYASLWSTFFDDILDPALRGEISKDTWKMIRNAVNYDNDIKQAGEQAAMTARNEKIRNRTRQAKQEELPPSMSQGNDSQPRPKPRKEGENFFDGLVS